MCCFIAGACFIDEGSIDVLDGVTFLRRDLSAHFEDLHAGDAFDARIGGGEPVADVWLTHGTEDGIGNGVGEHIGIAMAFEATAVRDGNAAEHERAAFLEGVDIIADTDSHGTCSKFQVPSFKFRSQARSGQLQT